MKLPDNWSILVVFFGFFFIFAFVFCSQHCIKLVMNYADENSHKEITQQTPPATPQDMTNKLSEEKD